MVEKATGVTVSASNPLTAKIDFSQVKEQSPIRPKQLPEGEYVAVIKDVEANKSKAGNPQWVFLIQPESHPSAVYPYYCQLSVEHAWKIRNILTGIGVDAPKTAKSINAAKLVGKRLGIVLEDDEYEGKMKSVIAQIIPVSEVTEGDVETAPEPEDDPEPEEAATDDDGSLGEDDDSLDLDDL
ncbi:hypothetical protein PBI_CLEO_35 [Gordonia phage Cleo]|uniref:Uncharacterized protein n=1 Tax=Gordonia phage Gibbous TaxID=2652405 RepID=A0A5J6T5P8_9CAUD|nr:hypothetical protein QLQ74_gp35 [Gordonia phage Gibbous]QFG05111.1 hypothetical protein SEA_GIBBOUS_35 [Gordonia phage Gibbous]QGJ96822.1 hypothetical protein PBI_CLEO_35 [Gordonia phage Cleo]QRI45964.1 hypothetical protein SEA_DRE3_35 [Gordonia phage Dre3]